MAKKPRNTEADAAAAVKAEPAAAVSPPASDAGPSAARSPPANDPAGTRPATPFVLDGRVPHFEKAIEAWIAEHEGVPAGVRVVARREGFRRGGRAFSVEPTILSIAELDDDGQSVAIILERLFAEPNLIVEFVAAEGDAA